MTVAEPNCGEERTRGDPSTARIGPLRPVRHSEASPSADELVRLLRAVAAERDRSAFGELFAYFAPRVTAFLARSGLPDIIAEEVTQETMLAMWRKASYFNPQRAGVSTWVFTIARNQRIDRMRREHGQVADGWFDRSEETEAPSLTENIAIAAEREQRVRTALDALPSEQAAIVRLSFFAERPHRDIARELGIPLGTAKSRIRLALSRLRALLDGDT